MPIYEFACRTCDHRFEELVKANGAEPAAICPAVVCPTCGSSDTARLMSAFSVRSASPKGDGLAAALSGSPPPRGESGCCGGACGCH